MVKRLKAGLIASLAAMCGLAACAPETQTPGKAAALDAAADADALDRAKAAIASATRPASDLSDDTMRKPAEVLAFIGVEPGMAIFEMEAGVGYYTELLSVLVGPDGEIVMQSPQSFDAFLAEGIEKRLAGGRLPNVRLTKSVFDNLDAKDNSADIVTWLLGPHELYFTPSDGSSLGDVEATYAEIYRILKPGGVFVVLDHSTPLNQPETTGALHRIAPEAVKARAAAAGLALIEESEILRNPGDDYSMSVFDPAVRRKTDRFLLKFQKPE